MSDNRIKEVLGDLFPYLESLETKCAAILAFLNEKGIATDEQLAPYLERAADASGVRWHAARLRMEHLFAVAPGLAAQPSNNVPEKAAGNRNNKEIKGKDESAASGEKDTSAEKTPTAKAATTQEADKSTADHSGHPPDNDPKNGPLRQRHNREDQQTR
jgi:hypothetical protein